MTIVCITATALSFSSCSLRNGEDYDKGTTVSERVTEEEFIDAFIKSCDFNISAVAEFTEKAGNNTSKCKISEKITCEAGELSFDVSYEVFENGVLEDQERYSENFRVGTMPIYQIIGEIESSMGWIFEATDMLTGFEGVYQKFSYSENDKCYVATVPVMDDTWIEGVGYGEEEIGNYKIKLYFENSNISKISVNYTEYNYYDDYLECYCSSESESVMNFQYK